MSNSFYIARFNDGQIDRKINLTQRDLTLAFVNGRLSGYKDGEGIKIYKVNLDTATVSEIPISDILERIQENKNKKKEKEIRKKKREIENEIVRLQSLL